MKFLLALVAAATLLTAADVKLGKPLTLKEPVQLATLLAHADDYTGKTVQVKGKITEVCQMMGCWMQITDLESGKSVKIQVKDGEIVFPKDAAGKIVVAEGKLVKEELTKEQVIARAKHEAEEQKRKFDASKIKSGATVYQIEGTGAVVQ